VTEALWRLRARKRVAQPPRQRSCGAILGKISFASTRSRFERHSRCTDGRSEVIFMLSVVRIVSIGCLGVGVLTLGACNRDRVDPNRTGNVDRNRDQPGVVTDQDRGPGTTTLTGANVGVVENQAAIDRIVGARCERETSCNNVGPNKTHVNAQACTQKLKFDMREDLNAKDCPRGIDQKELNECLDDIRKEACNNPIDSISRMAACRTSDLCLKTNAPNR
jgi:hypothetical protein